MPSASPINSSLSLSIYPPIVASQLEIPIAALQPASASAQELLKETEELLRRLSSDQHHEVPMPSDGYLSDDDHFSSGTPHTTPVTRVTNESDLKKCESAADRVRFCLKAVQLFIMFDYTIDKKKSECCPGCTVIYYPAHLLKARMRMKPTASALHCRASIRGEVRCEWVHHHSSRSARIISHCSIHDSKRHQQQRHLCCGTPRGAGLETGS